MTRFTIKTLGAALLGLFLLSGCDATPPETLKPQARPAAPPPAPKPVVKAPPKGPSEKSKALAAYYKRVEDQLLAQGLLRRDGGGPDTLYDAEDLARDFAAIAFFDEHLGGRIRTQSQKESKLHQWRGPVRVATYHGSSISAETRQQDQANVARYVGRLSRVTGRPIAPAATSKANFHVLFMSADDNADLKRAVAKAWPGFPAIALNDMLDMPDDIYCVVHTNLPSAAPGKERAIALIRAEHPDLMRLSCIHEELAQGLGLSNDSPKARPSIFNDDEEFATLTTHDEQLLKMLYDPRLRAGMSLEEARPHLIQIAAELTGEIGS